MMSSSQAGQSGRSANALGHPGGRPVGQALPGLGVPLDVVDPAIRPRRAPARPPPRGRPARSRRWARPTPPATGRPGTRSPDDCPPNRDGRPGCRAGPGPGCSPRRLRPRYRAWMSADSEPPDARSVTVTPSSCCRRPSNSVRNRISPPWSRTCWARIASSRSCEHTAILDGLCRRSSSGLGRPMDTSVPGTDRFGLDGHGQSGLLGLPQDRFLQPPTAHDLHRPRTYPGGLGKDREAGVLLDDQDADAGSGQGGGGGETGRAGSDDDDVVRGGGGHDIS